MKRAKQTLWLFPFFLLSLSVSPASGQELTQSPPHLTLSASTGRTGDWVQVTGTGFPANTSGKVFFDQNFDYRSCSDSGCTTYIKCGRFMDTRCEPEASVTADAYGTFFTSLPIPPGYKADFLGAGTYQFGTDVPYGNGAAYETAQFKVLPASFTVNWISASLAGVSGSGFAPYQADDWSPSYGIVWLDTNGDFTLTEGEPYVRVYVLSDGSLSACSGPVPCPISLSIFKFGLFFGAYVRANIHARVGDPRSAEQQVEASKFLSIK